MLMLGMPGLHLILPLPLREGVGGRGPRRTTGPYWHRPLAPTPTRKGRESIKLELKFKFKFKLNLKLNSYPTIRTLYSASSLGSHRRFRPARTPTRMAWNG